MGDTIVELPRRRGMVALHQLPTWWDGGIPPTTNLVGWWHSTNYQPGGMVALHQLPTWWDGGTPPTTNLVGGWHSTNYQPGGRVALHQLPTWGQATVVVTTRLGDRFRQAKLLAEMDAATIHRLLTTTLGKDQLSSLPHFNPEEVLKSP